MLATLDTVLAPSASAIASGGSQQPSDDEIAATQQSMLEELHAISEEALDNTLDHSNQRHQGFPDEASDIVDIVESATEHRQSDVGGSHSESQKVSDSRPAVQQAAELPHATSTKHPSCLETTAPLVVGANGHAEVLRVVNTGSATSESSSSAASQTADVEGKAHESAEDLTPPSTEIDAAIETARMPSPQLGLPVASHLLDSAVVAPHTTTTVTELQDPPIHCDQIDTSLEFDHADLFDGIEADAFDDIELSPPTTRRHVVLPPLDEAAAGNAHLDLPQSPTRTRGATTSQELADVDLGHKDAESLEPSQLPQPSQMTSFLDPCFAGFQTGHGKQVKPSEKALQAARKLLLDLEQTDGLLPPSQTVPIPPPEHGHATTRSSQAGPVAGDGRDRVPMVDRAPLQEILPRQSSAVINESERHPFENQGKSAAIHAMPASQGSMAAQVQRPTFATPKPIRISLLNSGAGSASPMRTPSAASGSRFTTPQPSKRISLGVLPRKDSSGTSTGKKRTLPRFVTPFKGGKRPRAEEQQDVASPSRSVQKAGNHSVALGSPLPVRQYPSMRKLTSRNVEGPAVFQLQSVGPRHGLADIGRPEYYSTMQMIAKGVPDEVVVILNDASKAAHYAFEGPDGALLMQQNALDELLSRGCSAVKMPWIQNHWVLILWKLAALVRLEPSSAPERWSWDELIRQLLYRYEREVHLAQRSCLKRIQEHDSSPARPMVLLISKILEEETEVQDRSGDIVMRKSTILELSDGWYRIQAQIDPVLTNACQRGRLRIGQKLAITGATLDAAGEGNEVLAAYHMSSLVLAANSVSLARWDAKLGFSATPFCASLRSLTPEGGLVSLMDVVLTKVYPLAYIDVDRGNFNSSAARGEQEEAEAREAWVKKREDAMQQLELQAESENGRLYDLVEALSDLAGDTFLPSVPEDPSGRLMALTNQLFDQLRAQPNPASAVRDMVVAAGHTSLVPWLHNLAKGAILAGEGMGGSRLGDDLDRLCPPRKVREFRVVRFRDARLPPPPPAAAQQANSNGAGPKHKNPYARDVQLTVYDAAQMGDELREGRRFLITNLMPSSKSAWRKADEAGDISLCTRRDTKWRPLS